MAHYLVDHPIQRTFFKNEKTEALRGHLPEVIELASAGNTPSQVYLTSETHSLPGESFSMHLHHPGQRSCRLQHSSIIN